MFSSLFSTWSLEWDRLVNTGDTAQTGASEVLLGLCVDVFKEGFISTALELVAGLGPCQGCSRYTYIRVGREDPLLNLSIYSIEFLYNVVFLSLVLNL